MPILDLVLNVLLLVKHVPLLDVLFVSLNSILKPTKLVLLVQLIVVLVLLPLLLVLNMATVPFVKTLKS